MPEQMEAPVLTVPVSERDHVLGPATAPVTLLEYGDFECPYCREAHSTLTRLADKARDRFRLVFRHFPLTQVHPHAQHAAEASEAAAAQDRFWEMHDMLYEHQDAMEEYSLVLYAETLGLDIARFRAELLQGKYTPRVREDFLSGVRSGVNGTPTFFVNGHRHNGPWDFQSLLAVIDKEAAKRQPTSRAPRVNRHRQRSRRR